MLSEKVNNILIIKPSALGDIDTVSQLHKFRGAGVFSGKIERYLLEKKTYDVTLTIAYLQ